MTAGGVLAHLIAFATGRRLPLLTIDIGVKGTAGMSGAQNGGTRAMIETIGIIGAGTMGNGIAQVCAAAGLKVTMSDISEAAVTRGMSVVAGSLERLVNKQKMTDSDRQAALARSTRKADLTLTPALPHNQHKIRLPGRCPSIPIRMGSRSGTDDWSYPAYAGRPCG